MPKTTYAIGPLWLEDWRDLRTEESFTFEVWDPKPHDQVQFDPLPPELPWRVLISANQSAEKVKSAPAKACGLTKV